MRVRKQGFSLPPPRWPRRGRCAAAALLLLAAAPPGRADDAAYRVGGVAVEAAAGTAVEARERALADAHGRAFARLAARLVPAGAATEVPRLDPSGISSLVASIEIEKENAFANRYRARLSFQFERAAVRRLMRSRELPFADAVGVPTLVLPVLRRAGAYLLWDRPNPWRDAWTELAGGDGLVPLIVPQGGLSDIQAISAAQAAIGDPARLAAITARYRAGAVIVAIAALTYGADGSPRLRTRRSRHPPGEARDAAAGRSFAADGDIAALMGAAAARMAADIQEAWKRRHLLRFDGARRLLAAAPLAGLAHWVEIRRRLARIPAIGETRLLSLSRARAVLALSHYGAQDRLSEALARQRMTLLREDGGWVIRFAGDGGHPPGTRR